MCRASSDPRARPGKKRRANPRCSIKSMSSLELSPCLNGRGEHPPAGNCCRRLGCGPFLRGNQQSAGCRRPTARRGRFFRTKLECPSESSKNVRGSFPKACCDPWGITQKRVRAWVENLQPSMDPRRYFTAGGAFDRARRRVPFSKCFPDARVSNALGLKKKAGMSLIMSGLGSVCATDPNLK